jgi:IclR family acetate operon transcriptional repressor
MSDGQGVVGAERVLTALITLAEAPDGLRLEEIATQLGSPKPTVHRALASLRRVGLAAQLSDGTYVLGDEFLRLAFSYQERRSSVNRIEPVLRDLSIEFNETVHYAVLDGQEVVYHAKQDPAAGAIRLSSVIGGRNPAHSTAVGKLLLAYRYPDAASLQNWCAGRSLVARTPNTVTDIDDLARMLVEIRKQGFATEDQESEVGVNCMALPIFLDASTVPTGAVSVSGLAFRTPLASLTDRLEVVRGIIRAHDVRTSGIE